MLVPYGVDNPMGRLPLMNWALIAANVGVFYFEVLGGYFGFAGPINLDVYGTVPAHLQWFQPLTSAFLHANVIHLFGNMVFLWTFGNNVNDKLGHWRYLAAYLAFAVLSNLGHAMLASGPMALVPCIGASGAIFGVVGTYLTFYPINDVRVWYFLGFISGTFSCSAYWIIGLFVAWDVYDAVAGTYGAVAVMAHLAGFAAGAGLGLLLLWKDWVERDDYDLLSRLTGRQRSGTAHGFSRRRGVEAAPMPPAEAERLAAAGRMRTALCSQVKAGDLAGATELYRNFLEGFPGEALDEQAHVELANWLYRAQRFAEAAGAFHHFARTHPQHALAANALYSAGTLYAQSLGQPARGVALLKEAAQRLRDPAKARRAREIAQAIEAQATPGPHLSS